MKDFLDNLFVDVANSYPIQIVITIIIIIYLFFIFTKKLPDFVPAALRAC